MAAIDDLLRLLAERNGTDPAEADPADLLNGLSLDDDSIEALLAPITAEEDHERFNRFASLFPDSGEFARHLYPRHLEFFEAGAGYIERCFLAANRVGKSVAGAFEMTAHLTGNYPDWWPGYRFRKAIRAWAAGDTNETTRDIIQRELLGEVVTGSDGRKSVDGSGMIPKAAIGAVKWKQGVPDLVDTVHVMHRTGRYSTLGLKSFDQKRRSFQGTAKELIWLDEECPEDVYGECLMRVATTRGRIMLTFTPLQGLTPLVLSFLDGDMRLTA